MYYFLKSIFLQQKFIRGLFRLTLQFVVSLSAVCLFCYLIADAAVASPSTSKAAAIWGLIALWFVWNVLNVINFLKRLRMQ
jgi:hypothetical protein